MRKLILITLLVTGVTNAQDKRFTLNLESGTPDRVTNNQGFDYAFNLGIAIEYQMTVTYFGAEMYHVSNLNGVSYTHFQGTFLGLNYHTPFNDWRFAVGLLKLGLIKRERYTYPMFGQDFGIEKYFNDSWYIGLDIGHDIRDDSKFWGVDDSNNTWYAKFKIGIVL